MQPITEVFSKFVKEEALRVLEEGTKATDMLKADHRKVELLFDDFEKADKRRRTSLLNSIIEELSVHTRIEESLIYPLLASQDPESAAEANEEHHVVKLLLAELGEINPTSSEAKVKVKVLSEIVKHHVKEEEHSLFQKVEKTGVNMEELGEKIKAEKAGLINGSGKKSHKKSAGAKPAMKKMSPRAKNAKKPARKSSGR